MDGSPPPLIVGLPAAGAIGKSSRVDCGRWDEKYAGIEFQPTLPPSGFVAAELTGLRPGRALDRRRAMAATRSGSPSKAGR